MIKLVWRTDVHMSDRAPSSRKDDWTETVLGKLAQVRDVALREKASAILDGGDFFHIKSPSQNSHELIRRVADHHTGYPCPVYCTPGNHDSVYGDYSFLGQQPLGVLFATGVFKRLYDEHEMIFKDEKTTVRVVGVPYHGSSYDMERFRKIKKGSEDFLVCVAHVLASSKGGTMFEGEDIVKYSDLLDTDPDVFCFGHWHKDQGVELQEGKTFVNVGSLTRGALSQDEIERRPACVILSFEKGQSAQTSVHRLDVGLPEQVFDVEGRSRQVRQQVEMDTFVEKMRSSLVVEKGASIEEAVSSLSDIPSDVRDRALDYLEKSP